MRFLLVALILGVVISSAAAVFFLQLPREEPAAPIGVERPIPEDVVVPQGVSRYTQLSYVVHRQGISPEGIFFMYGGQTLRLQVAALDFGPMDGWLFEIPELNISERIIPGEPFRTEVTPVNYNNYRVRFSSGDITHTAVLRVAPPEER